MLFQKAPSITGSACQSVLIQNLVHLWQSIETLSHPTVLETYTAQIINTTAVNPKNWTYWPALNRNDSLLLYCDYPMQGRLFLPTTLPIYPDHSSNIQALRNAL